MEDNAAITGLTKKEWARVKDYCSERTREQITSLGDPMYRQILGFAARCTNPGRTWKATDRFRVSKMIAEECLKFCKPVGINIEGTFHNSPTPAGVYIRAISYEPVARGTCKACHRYNVKLRFVFMGPDQDDELMCEECGAKHDDEMQED